MVKLPEFIFGTLSKKEGRLQQARMSRVGLYHDGTTKPLDPRENESITITVKLGIDVNIKALNIYYTTDGSLPEVSKKNDNSNQKLLKIGMKRTEIEWDTLQWHYLEKWEGEIPPQANRRNYGNKPDCI